MVYGDRLMTILAEEALCRLPSVVVGQVETPCGTAHGLVDDKTKGKKTCLVSVVRSGNLPSKIYTCMYFIAQPFNRENNKNPFFQLLILLQGTYFKRQFDS